MKVAVVGGGISGLSAYLFLRKEINQYPRLQDELDVTIYEPHDLPRMGGRRADDIPSSGGGYGLAANGMASLKRLDPSLHKQIFENGFPTAKAVMKSARGWTLGVIPFNDLRGKDSECCVMVLREVVIAALYERVPASVVVRQKVLKVEDGSGKATIYLDNGESHSVDLVIGADGIWSKARLAIYGEKVVPEYRGLFTVAGFIPTSYLPKPPETGDAAHGQCIMITGPNGMFAYTPYTTGDVPATEAHIRGDTTLPPGPSAFWWSRSAQADPTAKLDSAVIKRELEKRHKAWKDPTVLNIIRNTDVRFKIPTYVMPKTPTWAGKRVVLVGDAAHALPSSSGQGVSQSLEDAEALAILLVANIAKHNEDETKENLPVLQKTFQQYMEVRKAHVEKVLDIGNRAGDSSRDHGVIAEFATYGFMWAAFKLLGSFFFKEMLNYDLHAQIQKVLHRP